MTLIQTAKLNGVNPMAYLADVLERVVSGRTKRNELHTLLPWNWAANTSAAITGVHWEVAMTLIQTAKLNGINPMAYLADVLERVVSGRTKRNELHTLLPWNWAANTSAAITGQAA